MEMDLLNDSPVCILKGDEFLPKEGMSFANLKQQRLYLHESFLTKNLQEVVASNPVHESTASSPQPNGGIANVLQNYLITKHKVENNH